MGLCIMRIVYLNAFQAVLQFLRLIINNKTFAAVRLEKLFFSDIIILLKNNGGFL